MHAISNEPNKKIPFPCIKIVSLLLIITFLEKISDMLFSIFLLFVILYRILGEPDETREACFIRYRDIWQGAMRTWALPHYSRKIFTDLM